MTLAKLVNLTLSFLVIFIISLTLCINLHNFLRYSIINLNLGDEYEERELLNFK